MLQLSHLCWIMLASFSISASFQLSTPSRLDVAKPASGKTANFVWQRFEGGAADGGPANWKSAWRICEQQAAQLPHTNELRYFYKSILSEGKGESSFYLSDVMDTTTDQPNALIGERMCIVIRGKLGEPLQYAETNGTKSCSYTVNTVVCRLKTDKDDKEPILTNKTCDFDPVWLNDFKQKTELDGNNVHLDKVVFYSCLGSVCVILSLTIGTSITLLTKYIKLRRANSRKLDGKSDALFGGFMPSPTDETHNFPLGSEISDYGNATTKVRYDLLQDAPLQSFNSFRQTSTRPFNFQTEDTIGSGNKTPKMSYIQDVTSHTKRNNTGSKATGFL